MVDKKVDERGQKKKQQGNYNYGQLAFGKHPDTNFKISLRTFFGNPESEVFSVKFSYHDDLVAASNSDGSIKVFNLETGKLQYNLSGYTVQQQSPTTCIKWKPGSQQSVLLSCNADGSIMDWHMKKGQNIDRVLNPCSLFGIDYTVDGTKFIAVGKDFHVRVYDEQTKTVEIDYPEAMFDKPGHSNRIFSVKPHPDDKNVFMTAGWDSVIHIWDIRQRRWVGHFENVTVSGDSIDVKGNEVLAGCYRNEQQLLLFDWRTRHMIHQIKWDGTEENGQVYCYAAQFSKFDSKTILAASTGKNEVKLFDLSKDCLPCASVINIREGIYAVDYCQKNSRFAFAGGEGVVYIMGLTDLRDLD